jgi:hypothetical protein
MLATEIMMNHLTGLDNAATAHVFWSAVLVLGTGVRKPAQNRP